MQYTYDWPTAPLLFGRSYEDAAIELAAFRPQSRVFAIAESGETARALAAAGHHVTAVDINPRQVDYARGAAQKDGRVERVLAIGRRSTGWSAARIREFLALTDLAEQVDYWDRILDTRRFRFAMDSLLLLRFAFARHLTAFLPAHFGNVIRARLRRCWATHSNRINPFAWRLLLGAAQPAYNSMVPIEFACDDAAAYLESSLPGSFDAFALSNILDGATTSYCRRLQAAVSRAASPGATVVIRSFAEPHIGVRDNRAAADRSPLWGTVHVAGAAESWIPCSNC
jgi:S-adenosylmethionine:diacylglycerol 3-amino-3-carboxypropyl transferase